MTRAKDPATTASPTEKHSYVLGSPSSPWIPHLVVVGTARLVGAATLGGRLDSLSEVVTIAPGGGADGRENRVAI